MREDIERWNRKYSRVAEHIEARAEPELEQYQGVLHKHGIALELACGKGANALYLAGLGFDVIAADGSVEGLKVCQRSADKLNLSIFPVVMDFDQCVLPKGRFDLISVVRYLNRSLLTDLADALKPQGILFYKTFNLRHLRQQPGFNPDYLLQDDELQQAFGDFEMIAQSQSGPSSFVLARKRSS